MFGPVFDIVAIVATVIGLTSGGISFYLHRSLRRSDVKLERAEAARRQAEDALVAESEKASEMRGLLTQVVQLVDGESDVWRRTPIAPPVDYVRRMRDSIPILAFANLKGGVGKTTLAANLAGYFDARGERVLLVDLDYQGSLSAMVLATRTRPAADYEKPGALALLEGQWPEPIPVPDLAANGTVITAFYPLLNEENRLVTRWLLGQCEDDVRYRLAAQLLGPRVQTTYDRVIIDTGPRITLGFVNALAAATHVIVPTQLDALPAEAVDSFYRSLDELRPVLLPGLRQIRVVGTQKHWSTDRLLDSEHAAIAQIERILAARGEPEGVFLRQALVTHKIAFRRATGTGIAYATDAAVRPIIDPLGDAVARMAPSRAEETV
ncbi:MAG: ParA family protein [Paracoccaceae bacterium]